MLTIEQEEALEVVFDQLLWRVQQRYSFLPSEYQVRMTGEILKQWSALHPTLSVPPAAR